MKKYFLILVAIPSDSGQVSTIGADGAGDQIELRVAIPSDSGQVSTSKRIDANVLS